MTTPFPKLAERAQLDDYSDHRGTHKMCCPDCGLSKLDIGVTTHGRARLEWDGVDVHSNGEVFFDESSYAQCVDCYWHGTVGDAQRACALLEAHLAALDRQDAVKSLCAVVAAVREP